MQKTFLKRIRPKMVPTILSNPCRLAAGMALQALWLDQIDEFVIILGPLR